MKFPNIKNQAFLRKCETLVTALLMITVAFVGKASAKVIGYVPNDRVPAAEKGSISVSEAITRQMPAQVMPSSQKHRILVFTAKWCEPCQIMQPALEAAKTKFGAKAEISILDLDAPENAKLVDKLGVTIVPAIYCTDTDGHVVSETVGYAGEDALLDWMDNAINRRILSSN